MAKPTKTILFTLFWNRNYMCTEYICILWGQIPFPAPRMKQNNWNKVYRLISDFVTSVSCIFYAQKVQKTQNIM